MTQPQAPGPPAGDRRALVLMAVLTVVLVAIVGFRLLSGGGGGEGATPPTSALPPRPAPSTTTTTAPPGPEETFEMFTTKNPFLPLRPPPGAAPAGAPGAAPGAAAPGAGTAGAPGAAGAASGPGRSTEPVRGARVALLDVFADDGRTVANVRVGDTVFKVAPGQVFATNFKVVSLSQADGCGRFLFGDDQFRLCKGEETLK